MKRSSLSRRTPLKRSLPPKRTGGLATKRNPTKRRYIQHAPPEVREVVEAKWAWYCEARSQPCRVCGATKNLTGHHVISKQRIRQIGREDLKWDRRNLLALCVDCHGRHELAVARVPRGRLRRQNEEFAAELGQEHLLDRYYGKESLDV